MTTLKTAVTNYLRSGNPARGTRTEYQITLRKWQQWNRQVPLEQLGCKEIRDFLDWVYERAVAEEGTNPGRTTNKAREQLSSVIGWAWDQEFIDSLHRFPKRRQQWDVAGRHYWTKSEINALYFATHRMRRPRSWNHPYTVGKFWRCALVLFFNYGLDTGTIFESEPDHEPLLWHHVL